MRNQKGFTLIETIVAIGIATIILAGLLEMFINFNKIYNGQQGTARVTGSSAAIANALQTAVSQAVQVEASTTISGTTYTTDTDTLVLKLPSVNSTGSMVTAKYDYAVFYVTGTSMYEKISVDAASSRPAITKLLSDTINQTSFTYDNGDVTLATKVNADIILRLAISRQTFSHRLKQTTSLRNK
jgi:prepilin-type N-terminal cleavage/methylation domain-containing protein